MEDSQGDRPLERVTDEAIADEMARLGFELPPDLGEKDPEDYARETLLTAIFTEIGERKRREDEIRRLLEAREEQASAIRDIMATLGLADAGSFDTELLRELGYTQADDIIQIHANAKEMVEMRNGEQTPVTSVDMIKAALEMTVEKRRQEQTEAACLYLAGIGIEQEKLFDWAIDGTPGQKKMIRNLALHVVPIEGEVRKWRKYEGTQLELEFVAARVMEISRTRNQQMGEIIEGNQDAIDEMWRNISKAVENHPNVRAAMEEYIDRTKQVHDAREEQPGIDDLK